MDNIENRISPHLLYRLNNWSSYLKIPIIVSYDIPFSANQRENLYGITDGNVIRYNLPCINSVACSMTRPQIERLLINDHAQYIEYDMQVQASINSARYWTGVDAACCSSLKPPYYSSDNVVVAVIDTGIDNLHIDLSGKIIGWKNFINCIDTPYDDNGHGTIVSGIIGGAGRSNQLYRGVAPCCKLVGIKALNSNGREQLSTIVAAIDWAIENKDVFGIDIINLSLDTEESSDGNDAASRAVDRAVENGITVCVAAGNSGPGTYTIGSPASARSAITVGAMADLGKKGMYLADFSSRGPTRDNRMKPDITAPGVNIVGPRSQTIFGYTKSSGTSLAAPFVSGVVALMLGENPNLSPEEIKSILIDTSIPWGQDSYNIDYGAGVINAYNAIKRCRKDSCSLEAPQASYPCSKLLSFMLDRPHIFDDDPKDVTAAPKLNLIDLSTSPYLTVPNHLHGEGYIKSTNSCDIWHFIVTDTTYPVAITFIIPDWHDDNINLDMYLYNPNGTLCSKSETRSRQESINFIPFQKGVYTLEILSEHCSGRYFFDLSLGGSDLFMEEKKQ